MATQALHLGFEATGFDTHHLSAWLPAEDFQPLPLIFWEFSVHLQNLPPPFSSCQNICHSLFPCSSRLYSTNQCRSTLNVSFICSQQCESVKAWTEKSSTGRKTQAVEWLYGEDGNGKTDNKTTKFIHQILKTRACIKDRTWFMEICGRKSSKLGLCWCKLALCVFCFCIIKEGAGCLPCHTGSKESTVFLRLSFILRKEGVRCWVFGWFALCNATTRCH